MFVQVIGFLSPWMHVRLGVARDRNCSLRHLHEGQVNSLRKLVLPSDLEGEVNLSPN